LARAPYENVFLQSLIASGATQITLAREADGTIRGVAYDGPQLVFAVDEPRVVEAFVPPHGRRFAPRMIVAPRPVVEHFWNCAKRHFPRPAAIRDVQPVYALERGRLRGSRDDAPVARATLAELDELALHAARMSAGELGGNPTRVDAAFRARIAQYIEGGNFWRLRHEGALVFQCYTGSRSAATAQIQGVWSPPEARGRGYARRAFGAICDLLLDEQRSLCLYVNEFNAKAIAVYEATGFERVGEFSSILF
jgi:uncharacterized protein